MVFDLLLFELRLIGVMHKKCVGGEVGLITALRKHALSYCGFVSKTMSVFE